jgi:hypothetical protein
VFKADRGGHKVVGQAGDVPLEHIDDQPDSRWVRDTARTLGCKYMPSAADPDARRRLVGQTDTVALPARGFTPRPWRSDIADAPRSRRLREISMMRVLPLAGGCVWRWPIRFHEKHSEQQIACQIGSWSARTFRSSIQPRAVHMAGQASS